MQSIGYYFGEMFSMAVLFNFTKDMRPIVSFSIASATIAVVGLVMVILTKEMKPDVKELIEENSVKDLSDSFQAEQSQISKR